ncbi:methylenetetrahydrofolate reductase [NAD(P)H] [candidate division WOR-1 bacterium RIFOXYA12_FULL_43_27]|uniref:Methylenetetrahydrofolate reductase n=1 Tax=candidate division WOR-1 bacterium RIFOXYC2_FULL_46_14 TaxID=1802587 RepID=A0A1F4U5G0_UNCSA|nr:MAG: methylenetetrahydrofolate reductase [NAD(P)H] [candidate division WOR-1 bacterium RIFOXYA12_FULL_43_27]OGC20330.1 MAG: methylenetetrahydrofolate reductase [NAD(P)H] [candidate division WOR-1 bacterium RIFOXYB2_FULL_46_45]OGC31933.1 MAG: methylenetetrahydrofolate reductase [NAD(P)H] [candidate division WOR-1 bacterium RIFOXYA2_FULL_46_56]OGC40176.1 MAG: methylenetetrahydrofolate reductase [NAD(P)H] [candidate division WOR-1 bacterium RIFOXYC2_FULL_46_14]
MKVIDALKRDKQTLSFEFFPPKTEEQEKKLFEVIGKLKEYNPDFVSVTCGALGTTRDKTTFWTKEIKDKFHITPVAHLTCVAEPRDHIKVHLDQLDKIGVNNVLALRGDPPQGHSRFVPALKGCRYAKELVALIKKEKPDFCVGVAGYPEGHREAENIEKDTEYLKQKVEAGAEYIITQLFFEAELFLKFEERCRKAGITVPILPGIMIINSFKQITKMTELCGASIPDEIMRQINRHQGDQSAIEKIGIEEASKLCARLKQEGIPGLHFFVLNQAGPIAVVLQQLSL